MDVSQFDFERESERNVVLETLCGITWVLQIARAHNGNQTLELLKQLVKSNNGYTVQVTTKVFERRELYSIKLARRIVKLISVTNDKNAGRSGSLKRLSVLKPELGKVFHERLSIGKGLNDSPSQIIAEGVGVVPIVFTQKRSFGSFDLNNGDIIGELVLVDEIGEITPMVAKVFAAYICLSSKYHTGSCKNLADNPRVFANVR
jgi:hypothetical protein